MHKFGVIGNPVDHSLSPMIHHEFAKEFDIEISYEKILSPVDAFNLTAEKLMSAGCAGFNITLPFKINAYNFADDLTDDAKAAGAVNTIKVDNNIIFGENTDGKGLVNDLEINLEQTLRDKKILIIGAGGATRGILKPILDKKPEKILLANRTKAKSLSLANEFSKYGKVCVFGIDQIKSKPVDIVINATSTSINGTMLNLPKGLCEGALCYDLMYGSETSFMKWALKDSALIISDGLGMLVEQAAESFSLWRGVRPETAAVIQHLRALL